MSETARLGFRVARAALVREAGEDGWGLPRKRTLAVNDHALWAW